MDPCFEYDDVVPLTQKYVIRGSALLLIAKGNLAEDEKEGGRRPLNLHAWATVTQKVVWPASERHPLVAVCVELIVNGSRV